MKAHTATSVQHVADEGLARALLAAAVSGELQPFAAGPLSVGEWARQRGEPLYRTSRRVRRWLDRGVLREVSRSPRAGRAVLRYALAHGSFFVPAAVLPIEDMLGALTDPLHMAFKRELARTLLDTAPQAGTQVLLGAAGQGAFLAAAPGELFDDTRPGAPALAEAWQELALDHGDACALRGELTVLLAKYAGRRGAGRYLASVRLVPSLGPPQVGGAGKKESGTAMPE